MLRDEQKSLEKRLETASIKLNKLKPYILRPIPRKEIQPSINFEHFNCIDILS